jgi:hypothetical protein
MYGHCGVVLSCATGTPASSLYTTVMLALRWRSPASGTRCTPEWGRPILPSALPPSSKWQRAPAGSLAKAAPGLNHCPIPVPLFAHHPPSFSYICAASLSPSSRPFLALTFLVRCCLSFLLCLPPPAAARCKALPSCIGESSPKSANLRPREGSRSSHSS